MGSSQSNRQHTERVEAQHGQLQDLVPAYAMAILLGQERAMRFRFLAQHIEECTICEQTLAQLLDLLEPAYNGTLEPIAARRFDLSFLPVSPDTLPSQQRFGLIPNASTAQSNRYIVVLDHLFAQPGLNKATTERPTALQPRSTFGRALINYEPAETLLDGANISVQLYMNEGDPARYDLQLALVLPEDRSAPNGFRITVQSDSDTWAEEIDESGVLYAAAIMPRTITKLQVVAEILP